MNFLLQRNTLQPTRTFGELSHEGQFLCHVLEDAMRQVPDQPVLLWKIKHHTAIPTGRYRLTLEHSNRFGPDTLTIKQVEGFDGIRCHGGNTEADTEGCPLFGTNRTTTGINNCAPAVSMVKALVRQAEAGGGQAWITVANP